VGGEFAGNGEDYGDSSMITQLPEESRLMYLVRVASEYIGEYPSGTVDYDETTCDGYCLAEDLQIEWGQHMGGEMP